MRVLCCTVFHGHNIFLHLCVQFMDFIGKLSTGQISIQDGEVVEQKPESLAEEWVSEFEQDQVSETIERYLQSSLGKSVYRTGGECS